ncbi:MULTISPECIES: hypothetical protein [Cyanophyceae]|uniref:Uncharacterized protein n=1 Tax=Stenomitos frigidus AS-A4 TaxID=2933935 RepID=A0ABV0KU83_9CYAN|nr:hypothetical protein [Phormidium sp. FACHB-592]
MKAKYRPNGTSFQALVQSDRWKQWQPDSSDRSNDSQWGNLKPYIFPFTPYP